MKTSSPFQAMRDSYLFPFIGAADEQIVVQLAPYTAEGLSILLGYSSASVESSMTALGSEAIHTPAITSPSAEDAMMLDASTDSTDTQHLHVLHTANPPIVMEGPTMSFAAVAEVAEQSPPVVQAHELTAAQANQVRAVFARSPLSPSSHIHPRTPSHPYPRNALDCVFSPDDARRAGGRASGARERRASRAPHPPTPHPALRA